MAMHNMDELILAEGGTELLSQVEPLWVKLNKHHVERSPHFGQELSQRIFADRKEGLLEKEAKGPLRVILAELSGEESTAIGYCICSITQQQKGGEISPTGEIDSIYVEEEYRRAGVGRRLVDSSLKWLRDHDVNRIIVIVGAENEEAFGFYRQFGLVPRTVSLELKE